MITFQEWLKQKFTEDIKFPYVLRRPEGAIRVMVKGDYLPASRGLRTSLHAPEEPDEHSDFEIDAVTDEKGQEIDINDQEHEELINAFLQQKTK